MTCHVTVASQTWPRSSVWSVVEVWRATMLATLTRLGTPNDGILRTISAKVLSVTSSNGGEAPMATMNPALPDPALQPWVTVDEALANGWLPVGRNAAYEAIKRG